MKRLLLCTLLLAACTDSEREPVSYFRVQNPRSFGYVIGDEMVRNIIVDTRPGVTLQSASLPVKGPVNRWLNLNEIRIRQHGNRYEIDLRYQVFYAPLTVKALTLPGFDFQLNLGNIQRSQAVPAWQFTMSPLKDLAVRGADANRPLQPDSLPPVLEDAVALSGLAGGSSIALIAAAYLAFLYGYWPGLRQTVFKRALKKLRRISEKDMEQALLIVHHALNRLHKKPLYPDQLPGFFRALPDYRRLHSQLEWFFNYSNHFFFSRHVSATELDLQKLIALCEQCRKIEQGSR